MILCDFCLGKIDDLNKACHIYCKIDTNDCGEDDDENSDYPKFVELFNSHHVCVDCTNTFEFKFKEYINIVGPSNIGELNIGLTPNQSTIITGYIQKLLKSKGVK